MKRYQYPLLSKASYEESRELASLSFFWEM